MSRKQEIYREFLQFGLPYLRGVRYIRCAVPACIETDRDFHARSGIIGKWSRLRDVLSRRTRHVALPEVPIQGR